MVALRFRVEPHEVGERLDKTIARRLAGVGRRELGELFRQGRVRVEGRPAHKGARAALSQEIQVELDTERAPTAEPGLPLDVRLEREHYVVVFKPAGLPSVPLRATETGTLAGALLARYPEMRGIGHREREPGLIHRLDTGTSGLLVAARSALGFAELRRAMAAGELQKTYHALVEGCPAVESGTIDVPLAPLRRGSPRVGAALVPLAGDRAPTSYRVIQRGAGRALIEASVSHAYRHQVRAHLASLGHPILGDTLYGAEPCPALGTGHALHATRVAWAGTRALPGFDVTSRWPSVWEALLVD